MSDTLYVVFVLFILPAVVIWAMDIAMQGTP